MSDTSAGSKFDDIFAGRKSSETPPEPHQDRRTRAAAIKDEGTAAANPKPAEAATKIGESEQASGKPFRHRGKRSLATKDGSYKQVTAYIPKKTHREAMRLITLRKYSAPEGQAETLDFSELINTLLLDWIKQQTTRQD